MEKFDVHVAVNRNRFNCQDTNVKNFMGYVLGLLEVRLKSFGIEQVVMGLDVTHQPDADYFPPKEIIDQITSQAIYITEQQICRNFIFDQRRDNQHVFHSPFNIKPGMHAYQFADHGKEPLIMFHVCGRMNTGKSMVIHELTKLIHEISSNAIIKVCANQYDPVDRFDITSDPVAYAEYVARMGNCKYSLGTEPRSGVSVYNESISNVNL